MTQPPPDLAFERDFWGDCLNTYDEESKQYVYGRLMGVTAGFEFYLGSRTRIIDIGGGPVSMLLKTHNRIADEKLCVVVDPLMDTFPAWVRDRYRRASIAPMPGYGEDLSLFPVDAFDEAWIYNVLQHTQDPAKVIAEARRVARRIRLFEWVDIPAYEGHPHQLDAASLTEWLGAPGRSVHLNENGAVGHAFAGVFPA